MNYLATVATLLSEFRFRLADEARAAPAAPPRLPLGRAPIGRRGADGRPGARARARDLWPSHAAACRRPAHALHAALTAPAGQLAGRQSLEIRMLSANGLAVALAIWGIPAGSDTNEHARPCYSGCSSRPGTRAAPGQALMNVSRRPSNPARISFFSRLSLRRASLAPARDARFSVRLRGPDRPRRARPLFESTAQAWRRAGAAPGLLGGLLVALVRLALAPGARLLRLGLGLLLQRPAAGAPRSAHARRASRQRGRPVASGAGQPPAKRGQAASAARAPGQALGVVQDALPAGARQRGLPALRLGQRLPRSGRA